MVDRDMFQVPPSAVCCEIVRPGPGAELCGFAHRGCVAVDTHWGGGSGSSVCVRHVGDCPGCAIGYETRWQAFIPFEIETGCRPRRVLIATGPRGWQQAGIRSVEDVEGRHLIFRRGLRRRFVDVDFDLLCAGPGFVVDFPTVACLLTLFKIRVTPDPKLRPALQLVDAALRWYELARDEN